MLRLKTHFYRLMFFFILGYGFLYFSYKWLDPTQVNTDFIQYYGMIQHPFDFEAAPAPWVYRQWNAVVAHILWRLHLYYPDLIRFHDPHYDQKIFFAALLTNFLSVVVTAWVSTLIVDHRLARRSTILPLVAGMLCFFSFYLQETTITGQSDGLSWALIAVCYLLYEKRNLLPFCAVLLIGILQREIAPIIFLVFAGTDLLTGRKQIDNLEGQRKPRRFVWSVAVWSLVCFSAYFLLRHVIHAPGNESQTNSHSQLQALLSFRLTKAYVMQVFVGQNLFIVLAAVWVALFRRYRIRSKMLLPLVIASGVLCVISVMAGISNNAGRMLALLTPIAAAEITLGLIRLEYPNDISDEQWVLP